MEGREWMEASEGKGVEEREWREGSGGRRGNKGGSEEVSEVE